MAEDKIITTETKTIELPHKVKEESEYENPEELYHTLIDTIRKYRPATDLSQIEKAYKMASAAHKDQKRRSGEPYIIHPVSVAIILAELELDKESIIAGILHDIVEDTDVTLEQVRQEFGDEVALLVWCYQAYPVKLFQGQSRDTGGKFKKDVSCHGKGYPGYRGKTCRPAA